MSLETSPKTRKHVSSAQQLLSCSHHPSHAPMARKLLVRCVPRQKGDWIAREVSVCEADVAEDVVIRLAKDMDISPISRHIFALYHPHCKLWLSPNQNISCWLNDEQVHVLEFRIRFQPSDLKALIKDQAAFDYYFFQVRHDFRKKQKNNPTGNKIQHVLGLAVADIIINVIETHPHMDNEEAEQKLKAYPINDFVPLPPLHKMIGQTRSKCRSEMMTAWSNSRQDANIPKQEYIRTLVGALPDGSAGDSPLWSEYHVEQYSADLIRERRELMLLDFQPLKHEIRVRQKFSTSSDWSYLCCVEELCFIAVKLKTKTIEVSRLNGSPIYLCFELERELKSFVSLLDGYYRLSQKWSFSICKEISSPSLMILKSLKCHGPVGPEFARKKLDEKAADKAGAYILRQSERHYDEFVLDVCLGAGEKRSFRITESNDGFTCETFHRSYPCLSDLLSNFTFTNSDGMDIKLASCIPPSENDKSDLLLMCHLKLQSDEVAKNRPVAPIVFKSTSITSPHVLSKGNRYRVTAGLLGEKAVVVKGVMQEQEIVSFLKTANDWVHLRSDCLVAIRGVIMSPPSIVMDNYSLGPLDKFLIENQRNLKPVDLIEAATYCAQALWYLEEQKLIHGSIRCHNLFVSAFTPSTLKVKLSDPLSNCGREAPWVAPEEEFRGQVTAAGDLWSYGTTLWEIFSFGKKPASPDVHDLVQPFGCPKEVWDLIHGCWESKPEDRKQPQAIVRDIGQIMCEAYNSRRTNDYSTIDYSNVTKSKGFFSRSFGSSLSLRSSIRSTDTLLTGLTSESDLISLRSDDPYEFAARSNNESWLIEANQLSLEQAKILGQGCYGEVVKAVLTKWWGSETEVVAVKRINPNVPVDSGLRDMRREIEIMKKLSHRHIVEIKGFVEDPQLMLVMEYMELGSLLSYLKVHKHRMLHDGLPLKKFALDIVDGMKYLESKKIVHRDLAARNILVAPENEVKISDFGLAQVIKEGDYYRMRTQQCLPLRWYAPESIMRGTFTHKSDVWSAGIVLWEMYSYGKDVVYPEIDHDYQLLQKLEDGIRLECPENCPLEVYKIMLNCWKKSPDQRPSFQDLQTQIIALND